MTYSIGLEWETSAIYFQTSFPQCAIDYRKLVQCWRWFNLGWNVFYEDKAFDTYTSGTESLSGRQFRYSNHIPMLLIPDTT
jgi:hypothetical protein